MTYPGQSFGDSGTPTTRQATVVLNADVAGYSQQMSAAAQQTNMLTGSVDGLVHKLGGLDKWIGRKLFHFAAGDLAIFGGAAADAATYEKQLSTLAATAAVTNTSMRGLKGGIESAFQKFPVSRGEVIALTEALTNLGVTAPRQIASLTQTFLKLSAATGESSTGLAQGLTQFSRSMGVTDATQIGNLANSLLTVSKSAGVSASGVVAFAQNIEPMARQAGIGSAAVIGISAAFNKAGADGYLAGNTFNQVIGDITQLIQTGSPDLAKYANLIGVTTDQFKKMSGSQQIVDVITALSKLGPRATSVMDQLGIAGGVRAQSVLTALTQSGDLSNLINMSTAAQGNQNNLNKGANAAMGGFADSLARVRNEFTQLGTVIGTTFLKPMSMVANSIGHVVGGLNAIIKHSSSMIGAGTAGIGVAAAVGGMAMSAAGTVGTIALARMILKGGHVSAFKAGYGLETTGVAKEGTPERYQQDRFANNEMGFIQRAAFYGGSGMGGITGPKGPLGLEGRYNWRTVRNMIATGPGRVLDALNTGQARLLRESNVPFEQREEMRNQYPKVPMRIRMQNWADDVKGRDVRDVMSRQVQRSVGVAGDLGAAYTHAFADQVGSAVKTGWRVTGPSLITSMMGTFIGTLSGVPHMGMTLNGIRRQRPEGEPFPKNIAEALGRVGTSATALGKAMVGASGETRHVHALGEAAVATARDLIKLGVRTGLSGATEVLGGGLKLGVGAVKTAYGVGATALNAAFSLPGMIALSAAEFGFNRFRQREKTVDLNNFTNPIQKYNDLLGTTTSNLANFNTGLVKGASVAETMQDAMTVNDTVMSTAPNKPVVGAWSSIGKNKDAAAALLGTLPITDAKQLRAAQGDMAAAGYSQSDIQDVMNRYRLAGGPGSSSGLSATVNYGALGRRVLETEGHGKDLEVWRDAMSQSKSGARIIGAALSGIDSQRQTDTTNFNGNYAGIAAVRSQAALLSPLIGASGDTSGKNKQGKASREALARAASKITDGGYGGYYSTLEHDSHNVGLGKNMTPEEEQKSFIKLLESTDKGRTYLQKFAPDGDYHKLEDPAQWNKMMYNFQNTSDGSDFNSMLAKSGPLGTMLSRSTTFQKATGTGAGTPGLVHASIDEIMNNALQVGKGSYAKGAGTLSSMLGTMGFSGGEGYKQTLAAEQQLLTNQAARSPYQTRTQRYGEAVQTYQELSKAYNNTPIEKRTDDQKQLVVQAKANYEQQYQDATEFMKNRYIQQRDFNTSMARAADDYNVSRGRSERNFGIQMGQMQRSFLLNRSRMQADYDRQLKNQVATSAQTIYDPYQRVQAKFTIDMGTTLMNLQDQNQKLDQQKAQVEQLHKAGLSTQAIQELDLANPNNAQQLADMVNTMSPSLIAQINSAIAHRLKGTAALTQNGYNLQFTQMQTEFKTSLARTSQDYGIAVDDAKKAQSIALSDMADDYHKATKLATQDLITSMTEVTGTLGQMYGKVLGSVPAELAKYSPKAAAVIKKDLMDLAAQFPGLNLLPDNYGSATTGGADTISSISSNTGGTGTTGAVTLGSQSTTTPTGTQGSGGQQAGTQHNFAAGGISIGPQFSMVSEWSPSAREAHIPLNRGDQYLTGLYDGVARAVMQQLLTAGLGVRPTGSGTTLINEDHSTNFTGPMTVEAQDPNEMARKLAAKKKLAALSRPARHA